MTDLDAQDEIKAFLPELLLVRVLFIATETLTETSAVLLMVSSITSHLHCSKFTQGYVRLKRTRDTVCGRGTWGDLFEGC